MLPLLLLTTLAAFPARAWDAASVPPQAQLISPASFAVLTNVPPPSQANGTTPFFPPNTTDASLRARPFLVYDDAFFGIIGSNPTLTLLAETAGDPLFHEAVTWFPPTDEVFFVQNSGAPAAGTGLNKSGIIQKISLAQVGAVVSQANGNASGQVTVTTVDATPQIVNPNGGTNFQGKLIFTGEGQGDDVPPALSLLDPYTNQSTVVLNNFFGRQFNSLNDVAINPRNGDVYFTDTNYGYNQAFRPLPGLPDQVYRFNYTSGLVSVVADGFTLVNGLTFSPDGAYLYVTDTGINDGFFGYNFSRPATIYRYTVNDDGSAGDRQVFAFVSPGVADGIHCDGQGHVYAGCGDGVHVWAPSGRLIGIIYLGTTSANFQFAGTGRMVICAETKLYYVTLAATGASITDL